MVNEENSSYDQTTSEKRARIEEFLHKQEIKLNLMKEREIRARYFGKAVSYFTTVVGVVLSVVVVFTFLKEINNNPIDIADLLKQTVEKSSAEKYVKFTDEISELKKSISALESSKLEIAGSSELTAFKGELDSLSRRVALIESAVGTSPERMLSVPMLRKDFDNYQNYTSTQLVEIKSAIASTNETFKWLIGLVVTVLVGVLGVLFNSWNERKKT